MLHVRISGLLVVCSILCFQSTSQAVTQAAINNAIDKGVQALRQMQGENGAWPYPESGATSLAALTLLECGAKPDDKAVQSAAQFVRQASLTVTYNYSIALAILFLDRLGDPNDVPLIESLTVRLLAGQTASGGWNYHSPAIGDAEIRRLQTAMNGRRELVGRRELPREGVKRTIKDLPKEIQLQLAQIQRMGGMAQEGHSDNSNTQFATLALWVARRHGLPVENALKRVEIRFRGSQRADGGWGYVERAMGRGAWMQTTASMTCAGLLGLAVADGRASEAARERKPGSKPVRDANKDPMLRRGLAALSTTIGQPREAVGGRRGLEAAPVPQVGGRTFYFLWSLERVAVALDLKTIGKKDWYGWGAELLVANQQTNGHWMGNYANCGADTCFALLFLKRANLAPDLTSQFTGRVQDVGERVLKGGKSDGSVPPLENSLASGVESKNVKPLVEGKYPDELRPLPDAIKKPQPPDAPPNKAPANDAVAAEKPPVDPKPTTEAAEPNPLTSPTARMAADLVKRNGSSYKLLLQNVREGKGAEFTEGLALAIPQLTGDKQKQAREALLERMKRMKEATLSEYLADQNVEIRRAAALAGASKGSRILIPRLIPLLRDTRPLVFEAARSALKELSGQDFGPRDDASREERVEASRKWLEWWNKQENR